MGWNSVRVRLTLWNAVLLALLLAASGIALCYRVQADLLRSVDQDLTNAADQLAAAPPDRDRGGPPPFGRDGVTTPSPDPPRSARRVPPVTESPGSSPAGGGADRSAPAFVRPGGPPDWPRRPRILTTAGEAWGPYPEDRPWDWKTLVLSAAGSRCYSTVQISGEPVRVYSRPIIRDGRVQAVIQAAYPLSDLQRVGREQLRTLLTLIPFALLAAGLLGVFMTDRTLRPLRQFTQAAAQIGAEDLSRRLEVTGQDEFAELATTFNGMIARLDEAFRRLGNAYQRLAKAYEQQQRFTADASHELRTPLTRIKGSVSLALSAERDAGAYRQALNVVSQAADVMHRLIQDLLLLARADAAQLRLELRPLSVAGLLADAAATVPEEAGCPIRICPPCPDAPLEVLGDRDALARLLGNLLENARRHTPPEGQITLSAHGEENTVVVCVEDTGEGIPPEHLPRVCDRFYRVDDARARSRGGTGLGLAICRSIAEAHGGTLTLDSVLGRGTTVCVVLPSVAVPGARCQVPGAKSDGMPGG